MELSALALNIRSLIRWAGICLLGLFFLWLLWLGFSYGFRLIFPPPAYQADEAFGKILKPFENSPVNKNLHFNLTTPGQAYPDNPPFLPVYEIPAAKSSFDSLNNASDIADQVGLDAQPIKFNEPIWKWSSADNPNRVLKLNIVSGNFNYTYDWVSDPTALTGVFKTSDDELVQDARTELERYKALKDELKDDDTKVSYWRLSNGQRTQVGGLSDGNAALVEFYRKKVTFNKESYPVVEGNSNYSSINVWLSPNNDNDKDLLELNYTFWPINFDNAATYTLKTASQAYEELTEGKSFVASGNASIFRTVNIDDIYLAYFNPTKDSRTFQPVYVFHGSGKVDNDTQDFVAYVPAVLPDFFK